VNPAGVNILAILPAIVVAVTGIAVMVVDPFLVRPHRLRTGWLALAGLCLAAVALVPMAGQAGTWYSGLWVVDGYTVFFHALFVLVALLTTLSATDFLRRESELPPSEFAALLLFATAGALLMSGAAELMLVFIGLEIVSIASYILCGYRRRDLRSNESALKYFLVGSFASAFFLYGIALAFGATGSTNLAAISAAIQTGGVPSGLLYSAVGLILAGLAFKVALAPFHVWAPDVYEGAPTPVTAFMSVATKAAGFAVLFRIFFTAFPATGGQWLEVLWILAALTMVVGNVVAVVQTNIKRMLAYSSIAHAGYISVAFASGTASGVSAAMFYMLAYSVIALGAFSIVSLIARKDDRIVNVADYAGLASKRPGLAALLAVFLLSLAGIPGTAGFAGKFFIFSAAIESGLIGLTVIGVLTTVVSFYYYLHVIVQMYMKEPGETFEDALLRPATAVVLVVSLFLTLYLGLLPGRLLEWASQSVPG
jgi:NADH-quinone oxidoreductase subunit N